MKRKYIIVISFLLLILGLTLVILNENNIKGVYINGEKMLEKQKMFVYVSGEVNKQGKIQIKKKSTIENVLNLCQGITNNADVSSINVKRIVNNGEKIIIPSKQKNSINDLSFYEKKININTASKDEFITLDGIGEKTAEKIIEYRQIKPFKNLEEIMDVPGIGESKYNKIKDNIYIN